ncbi:GNAT family N-acetyltransferase [Sphingomonas sp. Leaf357]|uniref:GNAT family N-acetyltransferase n=1 Tax=Sphingomonas sp. Leaf357 TaxID=1736350 RepID=UPI0012E2C598|nr:GNAT family N-acetyltransferase [Sphingomonas sp. Leaf357]
MNDLRADPDLVAAWVRGRSIARSQPEPTSYHDGWCAEIGSDTELRRYVFAGASDTVAKLARTIDRPRIFLKACIEDRALAALLPPQWRIGDPSWMMTGPAAIAVPHLPPGYTIIVRRGTGMIEVRIETADGLLAASGYGAETDGAFVYDRIVTQPGHQRRGLGGLVMGTLAAERRSPASENVLVATDQGRALYLALGWKDHASYASAVIPDPAA